MSLIVRVKENGSEVLYFRIVEESGKHYVERPDSPSLEIEPGEDVSTTVAIALLKMKRRDEYEHAAGLS